MRTETFSCRCVLTLLQNSVRPSFILVTVSVSTMTSSIMKSLKQIMSILSPAWAPVIAKRRNDQMISDVTAQALDMFGMLVIELRRGFFGAKKAPNRQALGP